jgi:hypothetical protein
LAGDRYGEACNRTTYLSKYVGLQARADYRDTQTLSRHADDNNGLGDNVPASNLGRFVCVFVMLLGTVLVSMMTAACTEFLELTAHQLLVTKYFLNSRRTKRIFLAMVPLLQYVFRVKKGWRKND